MVVVGCIEGTFAGLSRNQDDVFVEAQEAACSCLSLEVLQDMPPFQGSYQAVDKDNSKIINIIIV